MREAPADVPAGPGAAVLAGGTAVVNRGGAVLRLLRPDVLPVVREAHVRRRGRKRVLGKLRDLRDIDVPIRDNGNRVQPRRPAPPLDPQQQKVRGESAGDDVTVRVHSRVAGRLGGFVPAAPDAEGRPAVLPGAGHRGSQLRRGAAVRKIGHRVPNGGQRDDSEIFEGKTS